MVTETGRLTSGPSASLTCGSVPRRFHQGATPESPSQIEARALSSKLEFASARGHRGIGTKLLTSTRSKSAAEGCDGPRHAA
jgi:hypothetical protein